MSSFPELFVRLVFVLCIGVTLTGVAAGQQIKFNTLYNCPSSSLYNFKVLNCPDDSYCNVFFKNSSPEGGYEGEVSTSRITAAFRAGGCTMDGAPVRAGEPPAAMPGPTTKSGGGISAYDPGIAEGAACVANVPPASTGNAVRPTPGLIKRVIYERYRDMESGRPVGITFKSLDLSSSFVNRLSAGGLLHQSAPVNAMIYRYKTDFFTCVKYTDSIIRMEVKEGYFRCFKAKDGQWACADDGRRSWDQTYLPVK